MQISLDEQLYTRIYPSFSFNEAVSSYQVEEFDSRETPFNPFALQNDNIFEIPDEEDRCEIESFEKARLINEQKELEDNLLFTLLQRGKLEESIEIESSTHDGLATTNHISQT